MLKSYISNANWFTFLTNIATWARRGPAASGYGAQLGKTRLATHDASYVPLLQALVKAVSVIRVGLVRVYACFWRCTVGDGEGGGTDY
jgi:hypothetical protein